MEVPSTQGGHAHFKYEENLPKHIQDMSKQTFKNVFFLLLRDLPGGSRDLDYSFRTLFKICNKTKNPDLITLKFGTNKQRIKGDSHTKFCMNSINVQDVTYQQLST